MEDVLNRLAKAVANEEIPDGPPHPGVLALHPDPAFRKLVLEGSLNATYVAGYLLESARSLVGISALRQGKYFEGCEPPASSRAAAAGAIALACASFEAVLNDFQFLVKLAERSTCMSPRIKLLELSLGLTPEKRLEAIAAICGNKVIDWGAKPYQPFRFLLSVRKYLLHPQGAAVIPAQGFWPSPKLKEVAKLIGSRFPLEGEAPLSWHHHILTPAGAQWAVAVVDPIVEELQTWYDGLAEMTQ